MSQFQSQPSASLTRPRFAVDTTSGPTVGVQAPQINNPTTDGDQSMAQLSGAIRLLGNTVGDLGDRQARISMKAERDADKQERAAEKARIAYENSLKNAASQSSMDELPQDMADLESGKFQMIEEDRGDAEMMVDRFLMERSKGFGPIYDAEEAKVKKSRLIRTVLKKAEKDQKAAIKQQSDGFFSRLVTSPDPEHLDSVFQDLEKQPGMEDDADGVLARAAVELSKNYSVNNDTEWAVNAIVERLNGKEEGRVGFAERLLTGAKEKAQTERQQSFANDAADIREAARKNRASPEKVKSQIEASAKKWGIESRIVEQQLEGVNSAIKRQDDAEIQRLAYEGVTNELTIRNFAAVNDVLNNAGDATTPQTGLIQPIDFQPLPGLPEELGGTKAQQARFVNQARAQTGIDLNNLDSTDGVNVNRWTRYVRSMAGSGVQDDYIKTTLNGLDFGTTDKEGAQVNNPQNMRAAQMYLMVRSINQNYAADMVKGNPQAKKFYDSVAIDMLTPGSKLTDQIINNGVAKGQVKPEDEARPGTKEYEAIVKAAPNLTPALQQYAVRTYNEQKGKAGALEYAVKEAQGRGVQLWQSWLGWANVGINPLAPFVDDNNAPSRPLVDLGTLATEDASVRPAIGTAMESLLEERAKEINKLDPTLKTQATDLSLNYIGNGVWEVEGIKAGRLDDKYDNLFFVTDAQVRERVQKNADTQKVESLADLEKQLVEMDKKMLAQNGGKPITQDDADWNSLKAYALSQKTALETKIKVRKLQESKKNP